MLTQPELGQKLKAIRMDNKLSLRDVEDASRVMGCFISNESVCQIETGKRTNPSMRMLNALCQIYEISPGDLFGE